MSGTTGFAIENLQAQYLYLTDKSKTDMHRYLYLTFIVFVFISFLSCLHAQPLTSAAPDSRSVSLIHKLQADGLRFTENKGQVFDERTHKQRKDVVFTARESNVQLFLTRTGISYQFTYSSAKEKNRKHELMEFAKEEDSTHCFRLDVSLVASNPNPVIIKQEEGAGTDNFYLPHCPNGIKGVKNYGKVLYKDVYPNIDWVLYSNAGKMEYDFVVHPGGNVDDIKLIYNGSKKIKLQKTGSVIIETGGGTICEQKPLSFLPDGSPVESNFYVKDNTLRFQVHGWDGTNTLTIDPKVAWSTYYGGNAEDVGWTCATDASGNVYLAGFTETSSGISSNGFQNTYAGDGDMMLVKFDAGGNRLWATYYGGNKADYGYACMTDKSGNVYLGGVTYSTSGIAYNGFQNTWPGGSLGTACLIKFDSSGQRIWGTYYGGSGSIALRNGTTDAWGNVYICGYTTTAKISDSIALNGYQNTLGGGLDAFLVKFDSSGKRHWATYYGGAGFDEANAVKTDDNGRVYLAGETGSLDHMSSPGGYDTLYNGGANDAFLVSFDSTGKRLWATYYGGNDHDIGRACAVDNKGHVYLSGWTLSKDSIAQGGFQTVSGGDFDVFLVQFDSAGKRNWATYYGGEGYENNYSCETDSLGNVYLTGETRSLSGVSYQGFQNVYGGGLSDVYLVKITEEGSRAWSTYIGGANTDDSYGAAIDRTGNIYVCTSTSSVGLASNGFQNTYGGGSYDAFLVKVLADEVLPVRLASFTAMLQNKSVALQWQTAQEQNLAYFIVEKSGDGIHYATVQTVTAKGFATAGYTVVDNNLLPGTNLYRLKMVDKDGTFSYSAIVSVRNTGIYTITVSPNPTSDVLTVYVQKNVGGKTAFRIFDNGGKEVYTKEVSLPEGLNVFTIPVAHFAKGVYSLLIVQDADQQTTMWIKE